VERVAQLYDSFADADLADDDFYAALTPAERIDILLGIIERYRSSLGEAAERFERVCRVAELTQG